MVLQYIMPLFKLNDGRTIYINLYEITLISSFGDGAYTVFFSGGATADISPAAANRLFAEIEKMNNPFGLPDMEDAHYPTNIVINGQMFYTKYKEMSFEDVVNLGLGDDNGSNYTMSYYRGPDDLPSGQLLRGESVAVAEGMVFSITMTNQA